MATLLQQATAALSADYILKQVRIASLIPGRLRVIWPALKEDAELKAELAARLSAMEAVTHFKLNQLTGSVLIEFDLSRAEADPFIRTLLSKAADRYVKEGA